MLNLTLNDPHNAATHSFDTVVLSSTVPVHGIAISPLQLQKCLKTCLFASPIASPKSPSQRLT